jgi:hypothetical protein
MKIENLLYKEIESEFEILGDMEVGTDKYKATVDGLTKLVDRAIELEKVEKASEEKIKEFNQKQIELDLKEEEMKDNRKHRWIGYLVTGFTVGAPLLVTIWGTKTSIKFEEEGTITTIMGRGFINKLLPKK